METVIVIRNSNAI